MKAIAGNNINIDIAKGVISVKHADGSETITEIPVKEQVITKPMANVGYSAQITKSMGNYESAKVSVSLHLPTDISDLEVNYTFATQWVDGKMNELIEMLNASK